MKEGRVLIDLAGGRFIEPNRGCDLADLGISSNGMFSVLSGGDWGWILRPNYFLSGAENRDGICVAILAVKFEAAANFQES